MIAGPSLSSLSSKLTRSVGHVFTRGAPLALCGLLVLGVACSDKKKSASPSAASAPNSTSMMFQKMKDGNRPLPPPSEDSGGGAPPSGAEMPPLVPNAAETPECKAFAEQAKQLRAQIDQLNKDEVGPASEKAEAASDEFNSCQDDPGCMSDVKRFEAKQSASAAARRVEEVAEKKVEDLETQLHDISEKQAARCSDGL